MKRPVWRMGLALALAAATATGCMEMGAAAGEAAGRGIGNVFKPHAAPIPCLLLEESVAPWDDSRTVPPLRAYNDTERTRAEIAVLVICRWPARAAFRTKVYATAIDKRSEIWEQDADGTRRMQLSFHRYECFVGAGCNELAVLPGRHEATLEAIAEETGKNPSRLHGRVRFTVEADGVYSLQACQADDGALFWVRDEKSLTCVSDECPST